MKTKKIFIPTLLGLLSLSMPIYGQLTIDPNTSTSTGGAIIIEPTENELLQRLKGLEKPTHHLLLETNSDWEVTGLYSASDRLGRVVLHNIETDEWMTLSPGSTSNGITVVSIADDKDSVVFRVGTNVFNWSWGITEPIINEEFEQGGPGYPPQSVGSPDP